MLVLENDHVSISFNKEAGWISSIFDKQKQIEYIPQKRDAAAFRLEQGDKIISDFQRFNYAAMELADGESGYNFTWEVTDQLTVTAKVQLNNDSDELHFYSNVHNQSDKPIVSLEYPIVSNIGAITEEGKADYVAHSFATGFRVHNPLASFTKDWNGFRYMPYPEGFSGSTMQFFSYYGQDKGGLYFAAYDREGYAKWLNFYKNANGLLEASFIHGCEDIGEQKGITVHYPVAVKVLEGKDWYEGADIYKDWATSQFWCQKGVLADADETIKAKWLLEDIGLSTFGINAGSDRSEWIRKYHAYIDTELFHILGPDWPNKTQDFGNNLPGGLEDWFPTKFNQKNIKTMESFGDKYAPFEFDYLFNFAGADGDKGKKAMQQIPSSSMSIDQYPFPFVCPADTFVQDLHVRRDEALQEEANVDAIYYDISANNILKVCMDESHGHPVGAGRQITMAYRENYLKTKEAMMKKAGDHYIPMGTEMMNEIFLDVLDFYQARAGAQPAAPLEGWNVRELLKTGDAELIPMFTYVYHEYGAVRLDGWGKVVEEIGDLFYFTVARTYLWGGLYELNHEYSPMEAIEGKENGAAEHYYSFDTAGYEFSPERATYISQFARLRTGHGNKYLAYGKMLRPLEFVCDKTSLDWFHYNCDKGFNEFHDSGELTVNSIVHSAWQYRDEGIGLFFANVTDQPQRIKLDLDLNNYSLAKNEYAVYLVNETNREKMFGIYSNEVKNIELDITGKSVIQLEIF
ncbi:DUF6259 domain-containing protein [Virgibacillus oceani]|uniref:DUF6259 domain-containing protein n=1 Tax=Virgibacillus oceani TaxID=1479511 RepID=A0A917M2D0_9BACI|nr:DUF6259 domain-containing protein [Virgibacillus oceani]GGG72796.1 hypothetical protein GCM10011398_16480 [Virgibacillus oceani]